MLDILILDRVGLVLLWSRMSTVATLLAPWIGFSGGMISWFVVTSKRSGSISILSTGDVVNAVAGNITSWALGGIVSIVLSLLFPWKFVSADPEAIARNQKINGDSTPIQGIPEDESPTVSELVAAMEKKPVEEPSSSSVPDTLVPTGNELVDFLESKHVRPLGPDEYRKANRIAVVFNYVFLLVAIILVPFTLFGTEWIFTEAGFTGWIVVSFLWVWCSMCICVIWPLVESWSTIWRITKGMVKDIAMNGRGKAAADSTREAPEA